MSTIATPYDGTTLPLALGGNLVNLIKNVVGGFAGVIGVVGSSPNWSYDLMLDQFGLVKESGEDTLTYIDRVLTSSIFQPGFKDLSPWDLSPEASTIFNRETSLTFPGTYYFSASTDQTTACFWGHQCPDLDIEILLVPTATAMGDDAGLCDETGYCFGSVWEPNDGIVNSRGSVSPQNGISGYVAPQNWASTTQYSPGIWYTRTIQRDHFQAIGFRLNPLGGGDAAGDFYTIVANTLATLPGSGALVADTPSSGSPGRNPQ